ncbi:MAG: hypothetical protein QM650_00950 [Microlunatus sp.]
MSRPDGVARRLLELQRHAGNRATAGLVADGGAARHPDAVVLQRAPKPAVLTDLPIATTGSGAPVKVVRVVGDSGGYEDRWMATAVARLATSEPAAVLRRTDSGRWCAVQTDGPLATGLISGTATKGASGLVDQVHGLPSLADLPSAINQVTALKVRLAELQAATPTNAKQKRAIQDEFGDVVSKLSVANVRRMALILGVPEKDVELVRSVGQRMAGKINVVGAPDPDSPGGLHGPVAGQANLDFHPELVTAVSIDADQFDDLGRAREVLFHEAHHLKDIRFAQNWVRAYQAETNRLWVSGAVGVKPFQTWLNAQVKKKRLTAGDAQLVVDESRDVTATTEARANIHTFLTVLQVGDAALARASLVGYAKALPPGRQYGSPPSGSPVLTELVAELKQAYRSMSKPRQADFRAAVLAAIAANKSAWISALKFFR